MPIEIDGLVDQDEKQASKTETDDERLLREHFELHIAKEAVKAVQNEDFIKASMLSWSYIEEYYLPTTINFLLRFHNLPFSSKYVERANAVSLIHFYYLLSHDKIVYGKLDKARSHRNKLVHNLYRSSSMDKINSLAKESASYNLQLIAGDLWGRESGKIHLPSTMIVINARNDLREELRKRVKKIFGKS